jgi:hypothetical protein
MLNISKAILYLYPDADPLNDFEVRDDGEGAFLAAWLIKDATGEIVPEPTAAELTAASNAADAAEAAKPRPPTVQEQIDELTLALADLYAGGV